MPSLAHSARTALLSLPLLSFAVLRADELEPAVARPPAVSGSFYPDDAGRLEASIQGFLADARAPRGEKPVAIVAPHAGYSYSGQIAADAWRQAAGFDYDTIVILGTNHTTAGFDGVSVYRGTGYRTPLGVARIDSEVVEELLAADPVMTFRPDVHEKEHSEEVQVPFAQIVFPNARIVAVVVGAPDLDRVGRFGRALARVLKGRKALIVASSDLSHYPSGVDADAVDRKSLQAMASLDPARVAEVMSQSMNEGRPGLATCACGEWPILAAMVAAKALGARRGMVISYAHSGLAVPGDESKVVGYGAVIYTAGAGGPETTVLTPIETGSADEARPTKADETCLLALARATIERYLATGVTPLPRLDSPWLRRKAGAFVTLNRNHELRGCIGQVKDESPLAVTVARMALRAARHDPRFAPVEAAEMSSIQVEISVLTPLRLVTGPGGIVPGRDGVMIEKDGHRAVYLPQVAVEQGWNRSQMLHHLCRKAGLPGDCWTSGARFSVFQALVFGEAAAR